MMWKAIVPVLAAVFTVGLGGLVGGFSDLDVNDEGALNVLNYAVVRHNNASNDVYLSQVAEVVRVQRQVVGGLKYVITVRMAKTPCRKQGTNEVCAIHTDAKKAQPYECTFTLFTRPWENFIQLLNATC